MEDVFKRPTHEYTKKLLSAVPVLPGRGAIQNIKKREKWINSIAKKALVGIIVTLLLALIYGIGEKIIFPTPDLSGQWQFTTMVKKTDYNPYQGMVLKFNVLLQQNKSKISGSGEKVYENSNGREKEYIGATRIPIEITGCIVRKLLRKTTVYIQYQEHGKLRTSITRQNLNYTVDGMNGSYQSTITDQSGVVIWTRGW